MWLMVEKNENIMELLKEDVLDVLLWCIPVSWLQEQVAIYSLWVTHLQIFLPLFSLCTDIWLHSACIHLFILNAGRRGSTAFYNSQVQRESFCLQQAGKTSRKHASPARLWQGVCAAFINLLTTNAESHQVDVCLQISSGWLGIFSLFSSWFKVLCRVSAWLSLDWRFLFRESSLFAFLVSSSCMSQWSVI